MACGAIGGEMLWLLSGWPSRRLGRLLTVQSSKVGPFSDSAASVQARSTHWPSPVFCLCNRANMSAMTM